MGEEKLVQDLAGKPEGRKDNLKDQGIDGRMGSKWTLGGLVGGGWIPPVWDRDHWQAVVHTVMNLGFWCHRVSYSIYLVTPKASHLLNHPAALDFRFHT
jgi:hypothetical protein